MINSIYIDNFKSLVDFKLEFSQFTCLVGLNGSGKSTVLQAMDFLSQLMLGDLDEWLKQRQWERSDINSKLTKKSNIDFKVLLDHDSGLVEWSGSVNRRTLSCTTEQVSVEGEVHLKVEDGYCSIFRDRTRAITDERFPIIFKYQGSVLSQLKNRETSLLLEELKDNISKIRSLDLLSPELLRAKTRDAKGHLGLGGQKLAAYIHEADANVKQSLFKELSTIYNQIEKIETKSLQSGWKQLEVTESFGGQTIKSTPRHLNDGMLRLMAILMQLSGNDKFLLFDEIENGINPELIEFLIDHLVKSNHQVLVTTHSPMILNFLEDDVARNGVMFLYKNEKGYTQSKRLFDIPSMSKKLDFMGPGEVFIDTDLTELNKEINSGA